MEYPATSIRLLNSSAPRIMPLDSLSEGERQRLNINEAIIQKHLKAYIEVGNALADIRDHRLYREQFGTFEAYCDKRWGIGRSRAYQFIAGAEVANHLFTTVDMAPANEAQVRPMTCLTPDEAKVVWKVVLDTAPEGKVTASHVQSVVDVTKQMMVTGAVDDGSGEQIKVSELVKAQITEETYERMQRQRQHIIDRGKKRDYIHNREPFTVNGSGQVTITGLPAGAVVYVSVWTESEDK